VNYLHPLIWRTAITAMRVGESQFDIFRNNQDKLFAPISI